MPSQAAQPAPLFEDLAIPQPPKAGIFPSQDIRELIRAGGVSATSAITPEQVQPASLDLRLGPVAYRVRASFLPGKRCTVSKRIEAHMMAELDLSKPVIMEKGCIFIVPLMESLALPDTVSAKANPKSTTGRLDVFTRLITDYAHEFEWVAEGYTGPLFVEIVPRTFTIAVSAGMRLNQLRFLKKKVSAATDTAVKRLHEDEPLVWSGDGDPGTANIDRGLAISVDLDSTRDSRPTAYRARRNAPLIDLARINHYPPAAFWDAIRTDETKQLILDPGEFYILASKESVSVPPHYAAEMVPFDPTIGEYRIHYAGFFDPGFGYGVNGEVKGTPAVLEVRAHEVPFVIEDGQMVGRLRYSKLLTRPDKIYGGKIGSSYQGQGLALSKQFQTRR